MRKALRSAALVGASILVGLALSEVALRILGRFPPADCHRLPPHASLRDVQTSWDLVYATNSVGMRDTEHSRERPAGIDTRIVVVGDSFAFGQGVEANEAFPARLSEVLRSRGKRVEVVNVSTIGAGPESYYVLLRDVGMSYAPDVVIVNLFGNDGSYDAAPSFVRALLRDASHHSHLVALARILRARLAAADTAALIGDPGAFWDRLTRACAAHESPEACSARVAAFRRRFGDRVNNLAASSLTDPEEVRREVYADTSTSGWKELARYLDAMARLCRANGCRLVIGIVPDGVQVDPAQREVREALGVSYPEDVATSEGPFQREVARLARRLDLSSYDPLESFRSSPSDLYFPADFHWTSAGHRRYAEGLADFLEASGCLRSRQGEP